MRCAHGAVDSRGDLTAARQLIPSLWLHVAETALRRPGRQQALLPAPRLCPCIPPSCAHGLPPAVPMRPPGCAHASPPAVPTAFPQLCPRPSPSCAHGPPPAVPTPSLQLCPRPTPLPAPPHPPPPQLPEVCIVWNVRCFIMLTQLLKHTVQGQQDPGEPPVCSSSLIKRGITCSCFFLL